MEDPKFLKDCRRAIFIVGLLSTSKISKNLSRGCFLVCPESIDAIQGAVGTVCEAVDSVIMSKTDNRAFVVVRPPGHHCGEDTPSGFCFVNNVAIGAAHGVWFVYYNLIHLN